MAYQLKVEKTIARPTADVFAALKEGLLFLNCGADSGSAKIDFRVGGKYFLEFKNHGVTNHGEFLEIVQNKKIVFTWCQEFGANQKPDTRVALELFADGPKTRLVIEHTGFKDKANCDGHEMGWTGGAKDMAAQLENGRLRMVRSYEASVEKLFESLKNPETFFGYIGDVSRGTVEFKVGGTYQVPTKDGEIKGEFLEIIPNQKITISWLAGCGGPITGSKVTFNFNKKEKGSSIELLHDGLSSEKLQTAHRQGWEHVTTKMSEKLGRVV
jgi:uncharacterized protein YndB with AHSA1/START domain